MWCSIKLILLSVISAVGSASPMLGPQVCNLGVQERISPLMPSDSSVNGYLTDPMWSTFSSVANTPAGYTRSFYNRMGSVEHVKAYLTFFTLDSYDPSVCAEQCTNDPACESFNLYFAREPKYQIVPGRCENPEPVTRIHCGLYKAPINATLTTNIRQIATSDEKSFESLHLGSNGYNRALPIVHKTVAGNDVQFSLHENLDSLAISLSLDDSAASLTHATAETAAQHCAELCSATASCGFFNTFTEVINGVPQEQELYKCAMFPEPIGSKAATLWGYDVFRGEGAVSHSVRVKDSKTWLCSNC